MPNGRRRRRRQNQGAGSQRRDDAESRQRHGARPITESAPRGRGASLQPRTPQAVLLDRFIQRASFVLSSNRSSSYMDRQMENLIQDSINNGLSSSVLSSFLSRGRHSNLRNYLRSSEEMELVVILVVDEDDEPGPPPASQADLDRLVAVNISGQEEMHHELCSVCLDGLTSGGSVSQLPSCEHTFHDKCITPWLNIHGTCPLCRKTLASED